MKHDDYFPEIEITAERLAGLSSILEGLPEEEREEAARRFIRYLQLVIKIADENLAQGKTLGPEPGGKPQVAQTCPHCRLVLQSGSTR